MVRGRDYTPLRETHASGDRSPEVADIHESEREPSAPPERTEAEWDNAIEAYQARALAEAKERGLGAADLVHLERQLQSEPREDQIRTIKADEERRAREEQGDGKPGQDSEFEREWSRLLKEGPRRELTEEQRARITKIEERYATFEAEDQARQDSRGKETDGRER